MSTIRLTSIFAISAISGVLFFAPSIDQLLLFNGEFDRTIANIWNSGHLLFFGLLAFIIFRQTKSLTTLATISILFSVFMLGLAIEFIQIFVGREASLEDVASNTVGAFTGYSLATIKRARHSILLFVMSFIAIIALHTPSIQQFADELKARSDFPVLADFESSAQLSRFDFKNANSEIENSQLHIEFYPDGYANTELMFFPRDWSNYSKLNIALKNPSESDLTITCRIHDTVHDHSKRQEYNDRFNQKIEAASGNSQVTIALDKVKKAPLSREMVMTEIAALICFTYNLNESRQLSIDKIWLSD